MKNDLVSFPDPSTWREGQILLAQVAVGMGGGQHKYRLGHILGGGLTSVVWKAEQLDENDASQRVVALKVLRPDAGKQYIDGLYDEQNILRTLWNSLRGRGIESPAIPEVYGFSSEDADIRYISMELVPGQPAADLVGYQSRLPVSVREAHQQADIFVPMLETLKSAIYAEPDVDEEIKSLATEIQGAGEKINESLERVATLIENRPDSPLLLSEKDVVTIGLLTAQVFQTLEDVLKRSYLDFQLKNLYFDTQKQQLKILDWNVVSAQRMVDISADMFRLAGGLFFLLTKVSIEKPSKLDEIRKLGGLAWSGRVSRAMRMVLERGLGGNPEKPFTKVYDWDLSEDWEMAPLSSIQSIGNAFQTILSYWNADLLKLQILIQAHLKNGLPEDADAVLQIAQMRLASENQPADSKYAEKFSAFKETIGQLLQAPYKQLEDAKGWLNSADRDKARQAIEIAYQSAPQDLMICRWKELIDQLGKLNFNEFSKVWKSGNLQIGMQALAEKHWSKAWERFGMSGGLTDSLVADAKLNQMFEATSRLYPVFSTTDHEKIANDFKERLRQLSDLISASQLTYKDLILRDWPEYEEWQAHAREREEKQVTLHKTLREIKEVTHG